MINRIGVCIADDTNPHYNLAIEEYLLKNTVEGMCTLYLWQNQNTVVIGRNQNPWKECRTSLLKEDGGFLARRLSGGGAVFHDLGNLNFTFLMRTEDYDLERQLGVIIEACRSLGISAERSGRNDILAEGRKFSGNAFYRNGTQSYHHGTLLVDVDGEKMGRYLNPSEAKLRAKGVDSVRSRVVNLKALKPDLTIAELGESVCAAFSQVYGLPIEPISLTSLNKGEIERLAERNASWNWVFGRENLQLDFSCNGQFTWGNVQIEAAVANGVISDVQVYSDAMDWGFARNLELCLLGHRFTYDEIAARVNNAMPEYAADICALIKEQKI